uniref:Glutamate-gated chloride channel alpha n=1 Tax=Cryptocotyle lingua TaxID=66766 RepID=A0A7U0TID4_9TREM|nr:glutamate-gated chloride channel alpha [Cryptocotyle lingua]
MNLLFFLGVTWIAALDWMRTVSIVSAEDDDAVLLNAYRRHLIPNNLAAYQNGTQHPLLVDVNMFVYSFSSISVVDMDYTMDLMLRQRWLDERLLVIAPKNNTPKAISYIKELLWLPDLFFRNAKQGFLHRITQPNYLIWIDTEGVVTFSQKISLKVSCQMNLWNFPMDTQFCKLNMGSYGYAKNDLDFCWWRKGKYLPVDKTYRNRSTEKAIEVRADLEINEFALVSSSPSYCSVQYSSTGEFSCLELEFQLRRRFGFYLIFAYLPSMLIVIIAWVSFLLDPSAVPARVSIGLLCVLSLITHSAALLTQLPRISYIKAMDLWVFACLTFVVSSLLEFAAANTIARRYARHLKTENQQIVLGDNVPVVTSVEILLKLIESHKTQTSNQDEAGEVGPVEEYESRRLTAPAEQVNKEAELPNGLLGIIFSGCLCNRHKMGKICHIHRLDISFAIGYPIMFVLFNIVYWTFYLHTR